VAKRRPSSNASSTANKENPIVEDGDSVVSTSINGGVDTGALYILT